MPLTWAESAKSNDAKESSDLEGQADFNGIMSGTDLSIEVFDSDNTKWCKGVLVLFHLKICRQR